MDRPDKSLSALNWIQKNYPDGADIVFAEPHEDHTGHDLFDVLYFSGEFSYLPKVPMVCIPMDSRPETRRQVVKIKRAKLPIIHTYGRVRR